MFGKIVTIGCAALLVSPGLALADVICDGDMMFEVPSRPPTMDLPVYLREQGRPS